MTFYLHLLSIGPKFARFGYPDAKERSKALPVGRKVWAQLGEPREIKVTIEARKKPRL